MTSKLKIEVDRQSAVPLYAQIAGQIEAAIQSGALGPGDRIENEQTLADNLGLSRPTLRQAIQTLVNRGLLVRRRGVGTQVVLGQVHRSIELTSLYEDLVKSGRTPTTKVLSAEARAVDAETARAMGVEEGSTHWYLERLRLVDGEPLALLENYLRLDVINLLETDLSTVGLYPALRARGVRLQVARQQIGARRATAREADVLHIKRGQPLLTARRVAYDETGRAVECGSHCYRADLYMFDLTLLTGMPRPN